MCKSLTRSRSNSSSITTGSSGWFCVSFTFSFALSVLCLSPDLPKPFDGADLATATGELCCCTTCMSGLFSLPSYGASPVMPGPATIVKSAEEILFEEIRPLNMVSQPDARKRKETWKKPDKSRIRTTRDSHMIYCFSSLAAIDPTLNGDYLLLVLCHRFQLIIVQQCVEFFPAVC
jgi:hypothetical protein